MRIEHPAEVVHLVRHPADPLRRGDDGAGDDVGVAVEVLRGAVQLDVETSLQRPVVHRRGEGVVDDGDDPPLPAEGGHRLQVGDLQEGVGQALHQEGAGLRTDEVRPFHRVVTADEVDVDAQGRRVFREKAEGAAVEAVLGQQVGPLPPRLRLQQGQQGRGDRRHAGARHHRRLAAADPGQPRRQVPVVGRVAQPQVTDVVVRGGLLRLPGGALEDGLHHRPLDPVEAAVDQAGAQVAAAAHRTLSRSSRSYTATKSPRPLERL